MFLEGVAKLALLFNRRKDGLLAVLQFLQIVRALFNGAQLGVIQPTGGLLAVAGDKGHCIALRKQLQRGRNLRFLDVELGGDSGRNIHVVSSLFLEAWD